MATNEILQFAETDTGTNLLTQAEYFADSQRPIGNQPGVARSKLINKALRQSSVIAAGIAEFLADNQSNNITDSLTPQNIADYMASVVRSLGIPTAVAGGTADAITADFTPNVSLTNGTTVIVRSGAANATTTPTFAPDGLTAKTIVKGNNLALAAGDIAGAGHWLEMTYDAALDKWVLQNPATGVTSMLPKITYLTSGVLATYTPTSGARAIYVEVVGGGGGGGGADGQGAGTSAIGASGGGGGYTAKLISNLAASYTYTIGAGGSAGASSAGNGTDGGTSTFTDGTLTLTATGGVGGEGMVATAGNATGTVGGSGGSGSGGDINLHGGRAGNRSVTIGYVASISTSGSAPFFGGGKCTPIGNNGADGTNYGEGGSAGAVYNTTTNYSGGAGASGVIRITEYF